MKPLSKGKPHYDYRRGRHYKICDLSGFKVPASQTRRQWDGLIVDRRFWSPRNPQDFVRAVPDDQTVSDPRPFNGGKAVETDTTLDAEELAGQTVLSVASTTGFSVDDSVIVFLDNDETHLSTISSISAGDTITINDALPSKASSGNTVRVFTGSTSID